MILCLVEVFALKDLVVVGWGVRLLFIEQYSEQRLTSPIRSEWSQALSETAHALCMKDSAFRFDLAQIKPGS